MTKEAIYDDHINPLMAQIIDICKAHQIAMVASFAVPNEEEPELLCTSLLLDEAHEPPREFLQISNILYPPAPKVYAFTHILPPVTRK